MSRKNRRANQRTTASWLIAGGLVILGLALGGWWLSRRSGAGSALRDTDTAFSIPTHVGQPAPEFTAVGVDGQPYTFKPGDGRPTAIVFYMGFQ